MLNYFKFGYYYSQRHPKAISGKNTKEKKASFVVVVPNLTAIDRMQQ